MDLEKTNKEYLDLKQEIENVKQYIELKDKEKETLSEDKIIQTSIKIVAERAGDNDKADSAKEEIERIDIQLEALKRELEEKKNELNEFNKTLYSKVKDVMKDPEMKQAMNEALAKRYDRQIKKYNKEKEIAVLEKDSKESEKKRYEALRNLINKHPALEKNLNGILSAKATIKKLNDELATLDYQKDATRIAEITGKEMKEALDKLDKNKEPLMNYINKNKINVKYEDIEKMADSGLGLDETIDELGKDIKGYNKKIKGYDKNIHNYTVALENIKGELGEPVKSTTENKTPSTTENKPKWYQFGKRFKNWVEQKRQPKLPEPSPKKGDNIRDALKYDIVRDLVGYDNKDTKHKIINHEFGAMEQKQLHEATGRKKEESEGR